MASKKNKYPWEIGLPPPPLDEHSAVKHDITSEYIRRYIFTVLGFIGPTELKLTIVDGFSGGGRYRDEFKGLIVPGSPFIILDAIKEAEAHLNNIFNQPKKIDAEYHFVESNRDYFNYLVNEINISEYSHLVQSKLFLHQNQFHLIAQTIINRIIKRNRAQRSIFILDQFGYKDVPFNLIQNIIQNINKSEVILTFSFKSLQSFLSDNLSSQTALKNIGLYQYIDWNRLEELKNNGLWQHAVQEQLSYAIKKASGAKHMTLFFFEPKKGWAYWLVHLSKEYKARSVMMDIHWNNANTDNSSKFNHALGDGLFALGYKAQKIAKQAAFDFPDLMQFDEHGEHRCIDALTNDLPQFIFEHGPILFKDLLNTISDLTAATESSIRKALQPAMDCSKVEVKIDNTGNLRRRAKNIKYTDTLYYKQSGLFSLPSYSFYNKRE